MGLCPKDMKPCLDDICYGGGCMRLQGEGMLHFCDVCQVWHADDEECRVDLECLDDYDDD